MPYGFSKENQSGSAVYRFDDFELSPGERLLTRAGKSISLQPKAFDALLHLLRNAGHLVSKEDMIATLWPSVHVSETNLTNIVVSLRKIVGRDAIRTVSKHGYRFERTVVGEPGIARETFERFTRARELTIQRSLDSMLLAQNLYWTCLAEDPSFAAAWAWLGRCCWFLEKFHQRSAGNLQLAQAAFRRAFTLDPDLAVAHQFYTFLQVDTGDAREATERLLERIRKHPREPESYVGLVQSFRFCGLLSQSLGAHERALELDPAVVTSVPHTLFLSGQFAAAIEAYGGRGAYYLDAAAWAALGDVERARELLRDRLSRMPLSRVMTALMQSLLALLENKEEDSIRYMHDADTYCDPEILVYFARQYARMNRREDAFASLRNASQAGFVCSPETLTSDPWLASLREGEEFESVLASFHAQVEGNERRFAISGLTNVRG